MCSGRASHPLIPHGLYTRPTRCRRSTRHAGRSRVERGVWCSRASTAQQPGHARRAGAGPARLRGVAVLPFDATGTRSSAACAGRARRPQQHRRPQIRQRRAAARRPGAWPRGSSIALACRAADACRRIPRAGRELADFPVEVCSGISAMCRQQGTNEGMLRSCACCVTARPGQADGAYV